MQLVHVLIFSPDMAIISALELWFMDGRVGGQLMSPKTFKEIRNTPSRIPQRTTVLRLAMVCAPLCWSCRCSLQDSPAGPLRQRLWITLQVAIRYVLPGSVMIHFLSWGTWPGCRWRHRTWPTRQAVR